MEAEDSRKLDKTDSEIVDIIESHFGKKSIKLTDKLADDLGADSLDVVELIMKLEEKYNISISDEDAVKIETVYDAVKYVTEKTLAP